MYEDTWPNPRASKMIGRGCSRVGRLVTSSVTRGDGRGRLDDGSVGVF